MKKLLMFTCLALLTVGHRRGSNHHVQLLKRLSPWGTLLSQRAPTQIQNVGDDLMTFQISTPPMVTGVMFEADAMDNTPTTSGVTFRQVQRQVDPEELHHGRVPRLLCPAFAA